MSWLECYFRIRERETTSGREVVAGVTTFAAMAYIIFVQPMIMSGRMFSSETGMDFGALITTTCLAAALGCLLMGLMANFPAGLAPGMGENFYLVLTVIPACSLMLGSGAGKDAAWQLGLGVVLVSGVIFAVLSFMNIRKLIMDAISPSLKHAIAAGIGLFVALIGLRGGNIVVTENGLYGLNKHFSNHGVLIFFFGLTVIVVLHILRLRRAMLIGIVVSAALAVCLGEIRLTQPFGLPADPMPVVGKMDVSGVFRLFWQLLPLIVIFTFMDVFDTLGAVVGLASCSGLMKDGTLPEANRIFAADATATIGGAVLGHSTVTTYIESAAGIESGGRTGLTAVVTGLCFLAAMFFAPFVQAVAQCNAVIAPALVVVGVMMMQSVRHIDWDDFSEAVPAFLIVAGIPFTYSIADGMILGFIAYPVFKLLSGRWRSAGWLSYLLALTLLLYVALSAAGVFP